MRFVVHTNYRKIRVIATNADEARKLALLYNGEFILKVKVWREGNEA